MEEHLNGSEVESKKNSNKDKLTAVILIVLMTPFALLLIYTMYLTFSEGNKLYLWKTFEIVKLNSERVMNPGSNIERETEYTFFVESESGETGLLEVEESSLIEINYVEKGEREFIEVYKFKTAETEDFVTKDVKVLNQSKYRYKVFMAR